ncbi:MAG: hypothetical protein LBK60_02445 [Verrucomicrobiales bacterium]|jgi:hypothetical protein|nr:hypothetical protein [Verrucomicrobiales bacterium]
MKWAELSTLILLEWGKFDEQDTLGFLDMLDWPPVMRGGLECDPVPWFLERYEPEVTAAVRTFAIAGEWPLVISREARTILKWRLHAALDRVRFLQAAAKRNGIGIKDPDRPRGDLLIWLLAGGEEQDNEIYDMQDMFAQGYYAGAAGMRATPPKSSVAE